MPSLRQFLLLPSLAAAHFTLNAPTSVGPFDEDTEATSPCGGVTVDFSTDNITDFHVGGEPIALFLGHVTANWLFRATLDESASSNWTQLYPIFTQTGLGDYCQPAVAAPESWAGQHGVLGVVADAPDGLLYQVRLFSFLSSFFFFFLFSVLSFCPFLLFLKDIHDRALFLRTKKWKQRRKKEGKKEKRWKDY